MRRFVTAGFLALFMALSAGCSDQAADSPTEPDFGKKNKVSYDCVLNELQDQLDALVDATENILMLRPSVKGALSNVDNMARKVCVEEPNTEAALEQYYEFETLVEGQAVNKLVGGEGAREALLAMAYSFATGGEFYDGFEIPEEALDPEYGGISVVQPGVPTIILSNNGEAALVADANSFPPEAGPVTIVMYRLDDPVGGVPGYPIPGYQGFPETYFFDANVQPSATGPGVEVWMCVVTDGLTVPFESLVIGHALPGGGAELWMPPLRDYDDEILDCTNATAGYQMALGPTSPGWLQLAGTILEPVVSRILSVKPLNAMYFKGTGLGGRGGSLSPFAPVVPAPAVAFDRSELNVEVQTGVFSNYYHFTTTNWADYPDYLFEEDTPGVECPSRTIVLVYNASDDDLIQTFDCWGSTSSLSAFSFAWPSGLLPPRDVYIELWDQWLDVRYSSNTVAIPIVFNTLTIEGAGTGGGTLDDGFYFDCTYDGASTTGDCEGEWEEWVRVGGVAPAADAGSTFDEWIGDCTGPVCDVNMDVNRNATMKFSLDANPDYTLSLDVGANGTVSDNKGNGPCGPSETCPYYYSTGDFGIEEQLVLRATPDAGYSDNVTWVGCTSTFRLDCWVTPAASMNVSADFVPVTSTLIVELTSIEPGGGTGSSGTGTISDDQGNSCTFAEAPCTFSYTGSPASVFLTVTPDASPGIPWTSITGSDTGACDVLPETTTNPVLCSFVPGGSDLAYVNVWREL